MISIHDPRIRLEHSVLGRYFGTVYWFAWEGSLCAELGLRTNSGIQYAIRLVLHDGYPDELPSALITHPTPLRDRRGRLLSRLGPDATMHILDEEGGFPSICHYHPARWGADMTLYKVAMKARVWLEAYESYLRTGNPIDSYLHHMTGTP